MHRNADSYRVFSEACPNVRRSLYRRAMAETRPVIVRVHQLPPSIIQNSHTFYAFIYSAQNFFDGQLHLARGSPSQRPRPKQIQTAKLPVPSSQ